MSRTDHIAYSGIYSPRGSFPVAWPDFKPMIESETIYPGDPGEERHPSGGWNHHTGSSAHRLLMEGNSGE
ncbi:hypothetical protein N7453_003670 [Penicillium expansum]|nr:hypothetical protein N7453_003670 [Penicillium expansum]